MKLLQRKKSHLYSSHVENTGKTEKKALVKRLIAFFPTVPCKKTGVLVNLPYKITVLPKSKKLKKNTTCSKCMHFINKTPKQKFPEQKIKF